MAKYQRPVCILTKNTVPVSTEDLPWDEDKIVYQGSARGCDVVGIYDFKSICLDTHVCNFAEGHPGAFGLSIDKDQIDAFVNYTDAALSTMKKEPVYFVDYIFQGTNIDTDTIFSIASLENLWGKDVSEPYVAIEKLLVKPEMVTIYDKKGYTIKIQLPNNISLLKFKATEEDCETLAYNNTNGVTLNIVGRCNANEWNGWVTPQIFIENYDMVTTKEYNF